jgi:2,3-bisphosphoglycerate-dependent phosphoglycerate mutase
MESASSSSSPGAGASSSSSFGAGASSSSSGAGASSSSSSTSVVTTTFLAIRHGETAWNVDGRLQGQLDIPLNSRGERQAHLAGAYLAAAAAAGAPSLPLGPFSVIYSSDLSRAKVTAESIGAALGLPVRLDVRLRETNLGAWQGTSWEDVTTLRAEEMRRWKADVDYAMPDGETLRDRFLRVACAVRDILLAHQGERVILVAHGGILDEVARLVLAKPFGAHTGLRKLNAAISVLACTRDVAGGAGLPNDGESFAALFTRERIDPRTAGAALGRLEVVEWGITAHLQALQGEDGKPLLDGRMDGNGKGQHQLAAGGAVTEPAGVADGGTAAAAAEGEREGGPPSHGADEEAAVSG